MPIDLSEYEVRPVLEGFGAGFHQAWAVHPVGPPHFSVYYDPMYAMAEVVYSKLARALGLNCVRSDYGINLRVESAAKFVSASEFREEWAPLHTAGLKDNPEVYRHRILGLITQQAVWDDEGYGFVDHEGQFIKANNGSAFFSMGLKLAMEDPDLRSPFLQVLSIDALRSSASTMPGGLDVLDKVAALSDSQIEACVKLPDSPGVDAPRKYFTERILIARTVAETYVNR